MMEKFTKTQGLFSVLLPTSIFEETEIITVLVIHTLIVCKQPKIYYYFICMNVSANGAYSHEFECTADTFWSMNMSHLKKSEYEGTISI